MDRRPRGRGQNRNANFRINSASFPRGHGNWIITNSNSGLDDDLPLTRPNLHHEVRHTNWLNQNIIENGVSLPPSFGVRVHLPSTSSNHHHEGRQTDRLNQHRNEIRGSRPPASGVRVHLPSTPSNHHHEGRHTERMNQNRNENRGSGPPASGVRVHLSSTSSNHHHEGRNTDRMNQNRNENRGSGPPASGVRVHLSSTSSNHHHEGRNTDRMNQNRNDNRESGSPASGVRVHLSSTSSNHHHEGRHRNRLNQNKNENKGSGSPASGVKVHSSSTSSNHHHEGRHTDRMNQNRNDNRGNGPPPTHRGIMGFKKLIELCEKDPEDILIIFLEQSNNFKRTLETDIQPDVIVLFIKCLSKICRSDVFPANKMKILNDVCCSNFIKTLVKYFTDLPYCKVTEKRFNSHFWNNMESFWFDIFTFYESVIDLSQTTAVEKFDQLLDVNEVCLEFLRTRQNETFSNEVMENFDNIKNKMSCAVEAIKKQNEIKATTKLLHKRSQENYFDPGEVTEDFRAIDIYPNSEELNTRTLQILRPNIIKGAYMNTNHYLDVQYRLMREDYISPIRDSIISFRTDPDRKKYDGGRFYRKTRFLNQKISKNCLGLLVCFDDQRKKSKYKFHKRFLYGSLLCFSEDGFTNIFFGTVAERSDALFANNTVVVELLEFNLGISVYGKTFVMFESDVYFPQYGPVLKALKSFGEDIPMQNFIVDMQESDAYPAYITNNYKISNRNINVRDENDWIRLGNLDLDKHQLNAFKMALTREFVTIQGPPGTGKTFIGLKIVETLLKNVSKHDFPILVLCYTNHALDQFLEGILKTTQQIIRIGGQSKNETFANYYNLKNLRKCSTIRNPYRADLFDITKTIMNIQSIIEKTNGNEDIVKLDLYETYLPGLKIMESLNYFEKFHIFDDPIRNWLMYSDNPNVIRYYYNEQTVESYKEWSNNQNNTEEEIYIDDAEDDARNLDIFENFESIYEQKLPFIKSLKMIAKDLEHKILKSKSKNLIEKLQKELHIKFCELSYLEKFLSKQDDLLTGETFDENNIYSSNPQLRWQIYWYLNKILKEQLVRRTQLLEIKFHELNELFEQSNFEIDSHLLKDAEVIGVTTTAAARIGPLIKGLSPSIVIVEEAAEVLESHIVVNLTNKCKQVILIGDHQQLRPTTATYRLGKYFNLDISLFERMFNNKRNCVTLAVQHRMRPEISNLLTPAIYSELYNHDSVLEFPDVRGVNKNLFFVNHNIKEKEESEINSKSNVHEAEFVIALAKYFIQQGYLADDITVIVAYSGQLFTMRELKKTCKIIENVRISVLDNFQGEENKIIILSLVRSNDKGVIGFLSIPNRVCVALSRAKHGFYIIGNMDLLTSKSELWQAVKTTLTNQGSYGNTLPLKCKRHNVITRVASAKDFQNAPEGGCMSSCDMLLNCGHFCKSICHVEDNHHLYKCGQKCDRECDYGHKCNLLCYKECKCEFMVEKKLPCTHEIEVPCFRDPNEVDCPIMLVVRLNLCSHTQTVKCFETKGKIKCKTACSDRLPCGHTCKNLCHKKEDPEHLEYECHYQCARINKNCSENHLCTKLCYEDCSLCFIEVSKKRNNCPHIEKIKCHEDVNATPCKKNCARIMPCGHHCKKKCNEECTSCSVMVKKTKSCGHEIIVRCDQNVEMAACEEKCRLLLSCGHKCRDNCSKKCGVKKCTHPVANKFGSICGHNFEIPCYLSKLAVSVDIVNVSLMKYCNEPCNAILQDCEHICKGTCGSCQSRLHQPCSENCGVTLICGHGCRDPCRKACNMCKRPCEIKCVHSNCTLKCGVPCIPCNMPCTRQCPHGKCSKNCGDMCDIPPCSEPCEKIIVCGHPCLGMCGDQCPKICKICSPDEFPELLFGDEDDDDARFISLVDCPHSVEVTGLDTWVSSKKGEILLPTCPYCKSFILNTPRYSNQIKITLKDINRVKLKSYGNLNDIVDNLDYLHSKIKEISQPEHTRKFENVKNWSKAMIAIKNNLRNINHEKDRENILRGKKIVQLNNNEITNLISKVKIMKCLLELFQLPNDALKSSLVIQQANFILNAIVESEANLSTQQVHDFNNEIFRMKILVKFVINYSSIASDFKKLVIELFKVNVFNDNDTKYFNNKMRMFGKITDDEKKMIVKAMDFGQGHWFKCPKGHIYCIGECGGAMETSKCPECGATIGGTSHALRGDNSLASEMDGATHSAYSEAATDAYLIRMGFVNMN